MSAEPKFISPLHMHNDASSLLLVLANGNSRYRTAVFISHDFCRTQGTLSFASDSTFIIFVLLKAIRRVKPHIRPVCDVGCLAMGGHPALPSYEDKESSYSKKGTSQSASASPTVAESKDKGKVDDQDKVNSKNGDKDSVTNSTRESPCVCEEEIGWRQELRRGTVPGPRYSFVCRFLPLFVMLSY